MYEALKDPREEAGTPLEQAKRVELYLLDVLNELCVKHGIRYFLDWGTLLGAFRHNGFIPWDDDIDVSMPMEDYKRFLKVAPSCLPETVLLQDMAKSPNRRWDYSKLRDCKSFYCESTTDVRLPCGIFIDIFPIVRLPRVSKRITDLLCWLQYSAGRHAGEAISRLRCSAILKICDCFAYLFYRMVKRMAWLVYHGLLLALPSRQYRPSVDSSSNCAFEEGDLFPLSRHVFEDREYPVPCHAEKVLEREYGDWRQLPPPEKRFTHATIIAVNQVPPKA